MDNEFDKQASKILRENISRDISGERWSEEHGEDHAHREELKKDGYVRLHRKGEFQVRPPWDGSNIARLKSQGWKEVPIPDLAEDSEIDEFNKEENRRERARDRGREAEDKGDWDEWNRQENKREAARDKGR